MVFVDSTLATGLEVPSDSGVPLSVDGLTLARRPQQPRSHRSLARMVAATTALIVERGQADFTLQEVSNRAGVSIGSIYGRVSNKEELVRIVQEHVYRNLDMEFSKLETRLQRQTMQSQDLQGFVSVAVAGLAELLRTYGKFIRAMIQLSQTDSVIAAHGRRVYADHERRFRACLLRCRRAGWQGEVDDAAVFCFRVIYDVVGAQLGFRQGARIEESQWSVMVDSLTSMMFVYLSAVRSE